MDDKKTTRIPPKLTTPKKRPGRPKTDPLIRDQVVSLHDQGFSASEIEARLVLQHGDQAPHLRTIQRIVGRRAAGRSPKLWSAAKSENSTEARLVLEVLGEVIERTAGRVTSITEEEAKVITSLRELAQEVPAWEFYQLVREYIERTRVGVATEDLDAFLYYTPWNEDHQERYYQALDLNYLLKPPAFLWRLARLHEHIRPWDRELFKAFSDIEPGSPESIIDVSSIFEKGAPDGE